MSLKIFISHSSKDKEFAGKLGQLLRSIFRLSAENVRCTSSDETQLRAGDDIERVLREEVIMSDVFVALLSENSLKSDFAKFEIGARWGSQRPLFPVLLAGVSDKDLEAPLNTLHAVDSDRQGIHQLVEQIEDTLDEKADAPSAWQGGLDELLEVEIQHSDELGYAVLAYVLDRLGNFALLEYPKGQHIQPPGRRFDVGELPHEVALHTAAAELNLPVNELEFFPPSTPDLFERTSVVAAPYQVQFERTKQRSANAHYDYVYVLTIDREKPPLEVRIKDWRKENPAWYSLEEVLENGNSLRFHPHDDMPNTMRRILADVKKHRER